MSVIVRKRLLVLILGMALLSQGCYLTSKPVTMSAAYRSKVQAAVSVIRELETRYADEADPEVYKEAMATARATLQELLLADAKGM